MEFEYPTIPNSKAIMGAVFMQYLAYGVIYIMEGSKYAELHASQSNEENAQPKQEPPSPQVDADGNPIEAADI